MALIVKRTERLTHPTEADTWFDVRVPLTAGDMAGMRVDGKQVGMTLDLLTAMIVNWSYDAPITPDTVNSLDIDTFMWINGAIKDFSGIRTDAEKNSSGGSSPPALATRNRSQRRSTT